ncbi:dystonin-like isoform X6 [Hypanus sabinus]|uniref:dystonin-like isoform X6 n=1 Tax=Hypanus sabinus TaxID=79690 RepID=UPI0028C3EA52|nr:dystonin-like isoform X6 [Hypanus sabinus]
MPDLNKLLLLSTSILGLTFTVASLTFISWTYEAIAGVVDLSTGIVFPIYHAIRNGLIDYDTGVILLEAQIIVSGLIFPEMRRCLDLEEALRCQLVDQQIFSQLKQLSNAANHTSITLSGTGDVHPTVAAYAQNIQSEVLAIKVLEAQLATGGLQIPSTGEKISLEEAFQRKFITAQLYFRLIERQKMCKELIDPCTNEKVSLMELMERTIVDKDTNLRLLPARRLKSGMITLKCGRETSVFRAVHEGLIDREVMIRLLGAQLFAGGLVDPQTDRRLTVDDAVECGLIDHDTASALLSHQVQTGGIVDPKSGCRLTMDEAIQCNLISSSSALLVLESHKVFMGLIWPDSGEIFSIDTSLQQGVVTNELAYKILSNRQKIAALYIPESSQVLTPEEARVKGIINQKTARVLSTMRIPDLMPHTSGFHRPSADTSDWTSHSEVETHDTSNVADTEEADQVENVAQNPIELQQNFLTDVMMHSYMDAGTGRRLLLVDSDLNEKVQMVMEASSECDLIESWQDCICSQEDEPLEDHLESKGISGDSGAEKSHNYFESLEPAFVRGRKNSITSDEHGGNVNGQELYWMPDLQRLPVSDNGESSCSQTVDAVIGTDSLDAGKTVQATETLENSAESLEATLIQRASSSPPDLNERVILAVNSIGHELENQLKGSVKTPEGDPTSDLSQVMSTVLQTSDSGVQEEVTTTLPKPAEVTQRTPTGELLLRGFPPLPLEMDFQMEYSEDLKKLLGLVGGPSFQKGEEFFSKTQDIKDMLVISEECSRRDLNNEELVDPSWIKEQSNSGGRCDAPVTSGEHHQHLADETMQWLPLEQQVPIEGAEIIPDPLESEERPNGSNKITSVPSLEDIADTHEMVDFVGTTTVYGLSEDLMDGALKIEDEVEFDTDGTSVLDDEVMSEDTDLENQVVLQKFVEESRGSTTDQDSSEEIKDAVMLSEEENLIEYSQLDPVETGTKSRHTVVGTVSCDSEKHREIMVIETLDDIADLDDGMVVEELAAMSDRSQNEKSYHCIENCNDDAMGNALYGSFHADMDSSIHQHTDDNSECWKSKAIVSVEGLEYIAETQEVQWSDDDFTGGKEIQIINPDIEGFEDLFEPSAPLPEDEMIFLNGGGFSLDIDEQVQSNQPCGQDFGPVKGQDQNQREIRSERMQESHQIFELDKLIGNLMNPDMTLMDNSLDISAGQQEKSNEYAMSVMNAEGGCIGRHLEEEEKENEDDGQITHLGVVKDTEWDRSILIKQLKTEVEAGGIFDPVTGERCNLDAALEQGLLDEEMVVDILVSQFQDGGITSEETGENLTLYEAVVKGLLQSHVAIKVLDKLGLIGGFYNCRTGEIMEVAQISERLVNNELLTKILLSEKVVSGVIHPETKKLHSINDAVRLGILDSSTALHMLEGQVVSGGIVDLRREGRLSVTNALKLCLVDEAHAEQLINIEKAKNKEQVDEVTRLRALSYQFEMHGVLDPQTGKPLSLLDLINGGFVERDAVLNVLHKQVEEGGIIQLKSGLRLSVINALRHGLISEDLADDLFELEASRQNICSSSSGKYLLPQEVSLSPSDFSLEVKENLKSSHIFNELDKVESDVTHSLGDGLTKEIEFSERRDNHLDDLPYSDLVKLSNVDIETGQRYIQVKSRQVSVDAGKVEGNLKVTDTDVSAAHSHQRKDLNDQMLGSAEDSEDTVQGFETKNEQKHSKNSVASDSEGIFLSGELPWAEKASAEDLSINQDSIPFKSPDAESSLQGDFFTYIREYISEILPAGGMSESSKKEDLLTSEEKLNDKDGRVEVEIVMEESCVEELDLNDTASTTEIQDPINYKTSDKWVKDVERASSDVKFSSYEQQALLTEMSADHQPIDCDDSSGAPEQKGNSEMAMGNMLKSVCVEPDVALKDGPNDNLQNPNYKPEMNRNIQEHKTCETLESIVDVEAERELVCRMRETEIEISSVSRARGNVGEASGPNSQKSCAESENLLSQDRHEGFQVIDVGDHDLGKSLQGIEIEEMISPVFKESCVLSENTIDQGEPLENSDIHRARVNDETDTNKKGDEASGPETSTACSPPQLLSDLLGSSISLSSAASQKVDLSSSIERSTEVVHITPKSAPSGTALCDDTQGVKKIDLLLDCLKQAFCSEEFRESNSLRDNKMLKAGDSFAGLKPEMLSEEVQDMFSALSEGQVPCTLKTQQLTNRLTDELSNLIRLEIPGLMEDELLKRQVRETLCKSIPVLLSTEGTLQNVLWQTVEDGKDNMNQLIEIKANRGGDESGDSMTPSGYSTGSLESEASIVKEVISDSTPNNDNKGDDAMDEMRVQKQGGDVALQSGNILGEIAFLEDAQDKATLEDASGMVWIFRNKPDGGLKEELNFGQAVSEDAGEMLPSNSVNKINLHGSNHENTGKLPPGRHEDFIVKGIMLEGQNITEGKDEDVVVHSFNGKDKLHKDVEEENGIDIASGSAWDAHVVSEREVKSTSQDNHEGASKDSFAVIHGNLDAAKQPGTVQEQILEEVSPTHFWIDENSSDTKGISPDLASEQSTDTHIHDVMQSHTAANETQRLKASGEKSSIKDGTQEVCHGTAEGHVTAEGNAKPCDIVQQCLQRREKLQAHLMLLQERRIQLESQQIVDRNLETLQQQLCDLKLLRCELEESVTGSLRAAEDLQAKCCENGNEVFLTNLEMDCKNLQAALGDVVELCSSKAETLGSAIEEEELKIRLSYKELLATLESLSCHIKENAATLETLQAEPAGDVEALQHCTQQHKDLEESFADIKTQLDGTAFDIQVFISDHALDLPPEENRNLLRLLNRTQTSFRNMMEVISAQMKALNLKLQTRLEQDDQKALEEKQEECNKRLQEIADLLTVMENKVIIYDSGKSVSSENLTDLQKHQAEHQALQKEIQANAVTLTNVVSATEQFLEKNGDKLRSEERASMENKLAEAKLKLSALSEKVDSNIKNLDKAVTTALKQETEKAAAVKQLKENDSKVQALLDWLSRMEQEPMTEQEGKETLQQNGNTISVDGLTVLENEDTVNGNLLRDLSETVGDEEKELITDGDLTQQYEKAKVRHQQVASQQQSYIISTQAVRDFLEKQGPSIPAEEREKLEKDLNKLKVQYEMALAQSESRLKLIQTVQDELRTFSTDYREFENWLRQSEQQLQDLQSGAKDVDTLTSKLKRQKSFSEDVISHKGDLRYITISGQRVLDAAKSCGKLGLNKDGKPQVDTSATCAQVQSQLNEANDCYKSLQSKFNQLGKNLKDVVEKYERYQEVSSDLLPWLQATEDTTRTQLMEAIAADPKNLQKQLEQAKALHAQISGHQHVVEKLRKAVDALLDTDGDLLLNRKEIQDNRDDVVLRYKDLSKLVNDRNESLQVTLTRSLSVQDGLDEMLDWMAGVEKSLDDEGEIPLNSAALQEALQKNTALEQNIASRQSSISAIEEKANKFIATADPSTASALQAKVDELTKRLDSASSRHKERTARLQTLRGNVELFEKTFEGIEQFVTKKSQSLSETDGSGKDITELSQHMQEVNAELQDQSEGLVTLNKLAEELGRCTTAEEQTQLLNKVNTLSKNFRGLEEATKKKEEDLLCCQLQTDQFKSLVKSFGKWVEGINSRIPVIDSSLSTETLQGHVSDVKVMCDEWAEKASEVQEINQKGSALCHLISVLVSSATSRPAVKSGPQVVNGGGEVSDVCDSKEMNAIQQDVADVKHQHEEVGALLKSKESQLDSMLAQRQHTQEEASLVSDWLELMDKRAACWDTLPAENEAVKEEIEQHKVLEAELKQNSDRVEQAKKKLTLLLQENPDSPEAGKWRKMLDYINSKWEQVSQLASERQQRLEESFSFHTQFETAEAQLSQWLVEKELMMNVLGPLSIDPHMLNNQKQQVQILLKEFETRKPQHEQLKVAAEGILSQPDGSAPTSGLVSDQLAAVTQKWDSLTGQLVDRSNLIDQAIIRSTQYQDLVRHLSSKLSALDAKLASQPPIDAQPEALKRQLDEASELRAELEQEEKGVQEAKTLCEEISVLVGEQYLRAELTRQLDNVVKPFQDLEERAGKRVHQLQSALANSEQFQKMFDDFQAWMCGKSDEQRQRAPISCKLDLLHLLIDEQAAFQKSLAQKAGCYEMIMAEGESLLQNMQPGVEKTALQEQLAALRSTWEDLSKQVENRHEKLRDCLQKAQKYRECTEHLLPWIKECEAKSSQVQVCSDAAKIESSLASIKALQNDMDKHRRALENLNNAADCLMEASQADVKEVQSEKAFVNQQVDLIADQLRLKKDSLDEVAKCLKEFHQSLRDTKEQLEGAKQQLDHHDTLGPQAYSNKSLTNLNAQQKMLQALTSQVEKVKCLAQRLTSAASGREDAPLLLQKANALQEDYESVSQQVRERCSSLEAKLQGIGQFQNNIREMFSLFADLDDELDSMAPVGRDLDCLRTQKDDIQGFIVKLQELTANIEVSKKESKQMLESSSSPDLLGLKRDLEALSKQCNKLLDRATVRQEQVEGTLIHVEEFNNKSKMFSELMTTAEEHEENQGSVGMETEVINQQLESFKVFQKEEIEPLQAMLQEVNRLGQGLIQSAAKNTNIQKLEHDIEEANVRWNTLTKKVAERAAKLQEALLHCGRFQDALESLLSWLVDTEELVANQKPPSAEFKVVKAQIQEQKLLQHLLDDRKPTVEMIKQEGEKIAESADTMDHERTLNQLQGLGRRWTSLLTKAESRQRQLEAILVVAQQFHDTMEPLIEWLSAAEKKVANSEPIGTQTARLQEQMTQHKATEDDVISHGKQLHQAISIGQSLKTMSSRDDKDVVQGKLDSVQTRYIEVQDRCGRKAALIQQALSNAWIFGEEEVEVLNWLAEVKDKLDNVAIQDYNPEHLQKQHSDHLNLHEDILLRKQHVDQVIQNGLALLKQTTGDEVIIIQERLDSIKARYAEVTTTSGKVLKTLEQALQLATKFQSAHEVLSTWLDKVEAELAICASEALAGEQLAQVQERQQELRKEMMEYRVSLDTVNEVSSALLELVPWRAREGLDILVSDDNERYRSASETIAQKVEEIDAAIQRSQQFEQRADAEIAWIAETERKLRSLGDIRLEQDQTSAELQVQKAFSMDILRHKDTIDELVAKGDQIMNSSTEEEKISLKKKLDTLQKQYEVISQMNAERYLQLERAQSLVNQFCETYEELWPWLEETRVLISQLPTPAIEFELLKQQQEELRQLRELIAEHKPHIDKMNKTGPQLLELSPREGLAIQQKYSAADALYSEVKEAVKQRAISLDEAISQSTQFHDKINPMLEALERIAVKLRQPPSISAEVEKIREQISENKNVTMELEKLQPAFETLKQRGDDLIGRSEGTDKDFCAKAVQEQLDKMVFYWADIKTRAEEREAKLLDVMDLAEKFWCDHSALIATIKDTQDLIRELEEPGIDPSVVKEQQEALETIKEEIDGLQEELEIVQNLGAELTSACGEPDKPVMKKNVDELNGTWDNLNKAWKDRIDRLDEAMQEAVQFQDALQAMFDWMDFAESKLNTMPPVGTDLETVKQQIAELKHFKTEVYQQQIEMERLNHQGELLLKKVNEESNKRVVQEPLHELKHFWENLDGKIVNRQHKLEGALLALGQFQHALDELMTWLTHTEELLSEQKAVGGDPKAIEIAIAKHHVLQNDVLAHKSTVETVNKAGNALLESSDVEEASSLQSKLESLNQRWKNVLEQTAQRQQQLHHSLIQAQGFQSEIDDMQRWLVETERQLSASKPLGGLPETAREQLNAHLELNAAFKAKEEIFKNLINKGQQSCEEAGDSNLEEGISNLKGRWESVETKLTERKVKLEEALNLATEFHNSLQEFINWLTQAEQSLMLAASPSLILDTILFQIDEHKVFANEVNSHREKIIELDKTGTHLKYFSQKQDVVLIKNLLISVQARWEKVVQRSIDRGRGLDDARKRAKQFQEAWKKLMEWLEESEKNLDSDLEIANDPDKVKMQLANHKEFQKALGAKHSVYDTTVRTGRSLKEKTTLADDHQKLDDMLSELRDKWDTVCGKSVERQNKLEEALLFSGQFTDALQALIDWLYKIEPMLAEDQPVHGDVDLVMNLIDAHKVFQKELGKRTSGVQALKRSARELVEASRDDSSWVKVQMQELSTRWETVCALSVSKQARLEQALNKAEEFHSAVHVLLEWLAEAEQTLRFHGVLPDDSDALHALIDQHKEFVKKLEEKMTELNSAVGMGESILSICHPDSITTIKHWITIIRARFEEVTAWSKQHQLRLQAALADVISNQELLESLLSWLQWAETILTQRDQEQLPQEIEEVKTLIAEHQTFMEEMTRKQPDVDKVTKTYKRKAAEPTQITSNIPVVEKGRSRKRLPTRALYSPATQSIETKNPRANLLVSKWQQVWLLALDRRRKLNDALDRLEELREFANFDFDVWRKKYMRWMNHKKSRVMDFFRRIDKDQDGKITRQEFIDGILSSKFPTSRLEMSAVADIFDRDGDGYIDYYEFVAALHPNKDAYKPLTDADKIEDEVTRQVAKCKCAKRFQVEQIGENKYRFFLGNQFGDSQQLRLVRILRSTVMVRVGGGWMALDEFLVKNDPCRAKGRTNIELREKFILPEGSSQSMAAFRSRGRRSRPSSRAASPNRSTSSASQSVAVPPVVTSTPPKTPQHLIRNYDKPWLTNSKSSSAYKTPESPERRVPSPEVTPIQGSKLRPPGYLSGKSFHSGEDSGLTSTPPSRGRSQVPVLESRKVPSRPTSCAGSKTGSRASSRRGSDASDFDISDIQSVCSDVSETVPETSRSGSRAGSRPSSAKPSKIPTPSRRSPATRKLSAASKR